MDETNQNKPKAGEEEKKNDDNLDNALDGFDDPLNLTAGEIDKEDVLDPELEKGFKMFMDNLKDDAGGGGEDDDLMKKFGNILAGLTEEEAGGDPNKNPLLNAFSGGPESEKAFEEFSKKINEKLGQPGSSGDPPGLDKLADEFLHMFMEKDILEEPLKEAKESYEAYLSKNPTNVSKEDLERYENQFKCIKTLLEMLEKNPNQKEELIKTFEEMQEYGNPPDEIVNVMGKDPLNALNMAQMFGNKKPDEKGQGLPGMPPNMGLPNDGDAPCSIF